MKRAAAMQPCLAAGVCRDVGDEVGFGCAGAQVSSKNEFYNVRQQYAYKIFLLVIVGFGCVLW